LPGLYRADSTSHHEDNGLIGNGETFPIHLPRNVSIQGTSALNTFFDLRGATAFEFGVHIDPATGARVPPNDPRAVPIDGTNSFISTVTFFGGGKPLSPPTLGSQQTAILLDNEVASHPTIVNCFFLKNVVGIIVNASHSTVSTEVPEILHDGTTVVHCTFYGNGIGIWNGQDAAQPRGLLPPVVGWSKLNLISNIFDTNVAGSYQGALPACDDGYNQGAGTPFPVNPGSWPFAFTDSAFEGIAAEDLRTELAPSTGTYEDFNAYERVDSGTTIFEWYNKSLPTPGTPFILCNLSPTLRRPGTTHPIPVPSRNIADITGFNSNSTQTGHKPRGILYVRDLFCVGRQFGALGQFNAFPSVTTGSAGHFDGSPHDLRLCPSASASNDTTWNPPDRRNPLVDNGYGGGWPARMHNGQQAARPGALPLKAASQWSWPFHALAFDGEGWGNPRVYDHPSFPNTPGRPAGWQWIDVGADEVADLIVAGYRFATTMFVWLDENDPANKIWQASGNATPMANHRQWYLGPVTNGTPPPAPLNPAFAQEQPRFRSYGFTSFNIDWPQSYLGLEGGRTWHSTESTSMPPNPPEVFARPWRFDPTLLPPPQAPACGSSNGLNDMTRATAADITPHLLPDLHPWWTQMFNTPAQPRWFAGYMPPSFLLWQPVPIPAASRLASTTRRCTTSARRPARRTPAPA
jgi:hypothetical protein